MNEKIKNIVLYIGYLCFVSNSNAQNFEWLNSFGTQTHLESIAGIKGLQDGGFCSLVVSDSYSNKADTLRFGKYTFLTPKTSERSQFLIRCNDSGHVLNAVDIGSFYAQEICGDESDNIYLTGKLKENSTISGKSLNTSNGRILFAKYNSKLQMQWVVQTSDTVGATQPFRIVYSSGHLYFILWLNGKAKIGNVNYNLFPYGGDIVGELDTSNGDVIWSNCPYPSTSSSNIRIMDVLYLRNRVYYTGVTGFQNVVIINKDTIAKNAGFIIQNSIFGVYQKRVSIKTKGSSVSGQYAFWPISLATDGKDIFLSGSFHDSIYWFGDTIAPGFLSGSKKREIFISSLTSNLQPKWFYFPKVNSQLGSQFSGLSRSVFWKGYLYFGGKMDYAATLDSNLIDNGIGKGNLIFIKTDVNGNVLWSASGGKYSDMVYLNGAGNQLYIGGGFSDTVFFPPYQSISKGRSDAFITRISDNTITRGTVSKGPYCAGDTFRIPYTKEGNFDSLNYFIAELSDENGSFDKGARRLGAVRTNKDSVIRGVLPLFQVQSSPNYRIRVRSTRPAVQSFYKLDTLELLIYSRDKAYAGKDTAICPGDTITLKTYGGTKWEWSPKQNMQDSTKSSTKVWPTKTTKYRIVISDSSGCGAADTAYKTVILRYPKASLNTTDSTVCKGDTLWLTSTFKSGDSTGYNWQWQSQETGAWITQSKGQNQQQTVFGYKYNQDTAIALRLLLSDGCPRPQDTSLVNVGPKSPLKLLLQNQDTLLCAGVPYTAKAKGQGGDAANYQFRWALMPSNTQLSGADSIHWVPTQNSQLRITLADGCMEREDTQYVQINIRKPLQANSNLRDSTLCFGQHTSYTAQGTGGDTANYQYSWILNGETIGTGKTLHVTSEKHFSDTGGQKTLQLILSDNCSTISDTVSAAIRVRPKLQAQLLYDSVFCFGTSKTLKAMGTGGTGNYRFTWYDPSGKQISTSDSIVLNHNDKLIIGAMRYLAILSDGCSTPQDSQIATLNFLSPLTARISSPDSCLKTNTTLTATITGGDGYYTYHWYQNQLLQGQSNTLNIPLPVNETQYKLIAKDGCSNDSAVASKTVSPFPQIRTSSDKDSGCEKLRVQFTATRQNQTTNEYRYTVAGSRTNWSKDSSYAFTFVAGKYTPIVEVKTMLGCTDTLQFKSITVHPKPTAAYSYTPARPVPKKPEVQFLNRSIGGVKYQWNFGKFGSSSAFQPKVSMTDTGEQNVYLVAINAKGCTDTSRGTVKVYEDYSVLLPTAFTPGADNLNGQFTPEFMGVENYTLSIYNRWGQLLFTAENQGWDGTYNGKAVPEGMYVYTLKITTFTYDKVQEQGVVMVLRGQ